jgi:hypothetical protein
MWPLSVSSSLQAAGIAVKKAKTIGIAVDHRRTNKSTESLLLNVERLKKYMGNLVVFPKKGKGEAPAIPQLQGTVMPIVQQVAAQESRAITAVSSSKVVEALLCSVLFSTLLVRLALRRRFFFATAAVGDIHDVCPIAWFKQISFLA